MIYLLTPNEKLSCDRNTITEDITAGVLTERAARAVFCALSSEKQRNYYIFCGGGGNGGDGYALSRMLCEAGINVYVTDLSTGQKSAECERQYKAALTCGVPVSDVLPVLSDGVIIDAIFGAGLNRAVSGIYADTIELINSSGLPVVSVDIPSGINGENGAVMGTAVHAGDTVAITCLMRGHILFPGAEFCGNLHTAGIGVATNTVSPRCFMPEESDIKRMPTRPRRSNKGTFGRVLTVTGSCGMCGAAILCARACYRTGAGLVEVLTPNENRIPLQAAVPEAVVTCYDSVNPDISAVYSAVMRADTVVIGCGLGKGKTSGTVLSAVLSAWSALDKAVPLIIDADALSIISESPALAELIPQARRGYVIITPHPGEASRLTEKSVPEILGNISAAASGLSQAYGFATVLKDAHTVTCSPDGQLCVNNAGNSGMATAGSGDVLAGIIAGVAVQNRASCVPLFESAWLGVYIHSLAGDRAPSRYSLTASDIIEALPEILV